MISELLSATVLTSVVVKSFYSLKQNGRYQTVDFVRVLNNFITSRYLWIWYKIYFQSCIKVPSLCWPVAGDVWGVRLVVVWPLALARMVSVAGDNVSGARRGGGTPVVPTIAQWSLVTNRAVNEPSQYSEKDFFALLKVPTSAFTIC